MTCEHCKARVESRLNELDGVSAKVNLKRKTAVASMEKEIICTADGEEYCCRGVVIPSNVKHTIVSNGTPVIIFLFEETTITAEQTGISFSGFLIMARIEKTYEGILMGKNVTSASVDAGFYSPAHFASVNKKMFGITASTLVGNTNVYRIAEI